MKEQKSASGQATNHSPIDATHHRFQIALSVLPLGVCLYDHKDFLLLWNAKFEDLYGLHGLLRERMHLDQVVNLTVKAGKYGNRSAAAILRDRHAFIANKKRARVDQIFENGTTVEIVHVPLDGGGWLATYEDVTASKAAKQQLSFLANHDPLTGLANRRRFTDVATALIAKPNEHQAALILMDLDHFKHVNDALGHAAGDILLKQVADVFRKAAPDAYLISRLGGDEFALLYERPFNLGQVALRAEAILDTLANVTTRIGGSEVVTTASFGVAFHEVGMNLDAFVNETDAALYRHKRQKLKIREFKG